MVTTVPRFIIFSDTDNELICRLESLSDCYDFLTTKIHPSRLSNFAIIDLLEDIAIYAKYFVKSFVDGIETFEDFELLQIAYIPSFNVEYKIVSD